MQREKIQSEQKGDKKFKGEDGGSAALAEAVQMGQI